MSLPPNCVIRLSTLWLISMVHGEKTMESKAFILYAISSLILYFSLGERITGKWTTGKMTPDVEGAWSRTPLAPATLKPRLGLLLSMVELVRLIVLTKYYMDCFRCHARRYQCGQRGVPCTHCSHPERLTAFTRHQRRGSLSPG
jgi:hypothetical protein